MLDKKFVVLLALVLGAGLFWFLGGVGGSEDLAVGPGLAREAEGGGAASAPRLELPSGERRVELVAKGSEETSGEDLVGEAAEPEPLKTTPFFGRIVERGTGAAIAGVALADRDVVRLAEGIQARDLLATTDADGRFEMAGRWWGPGQVLRSREVLECGMRVSR